jgi:hypothetical protein
VLLDSNIIIYAPQPGMGAIKKLIAQHPTSVSIISYIEVLGFPSQRKCNWKPILQSRRYFRSPNQLLL